MLVKIPVYFVHICEKVAYATDIFPVVFWNFQNSSSLEYLKTWRYNVDKTSQQYIHAEKNDKLRHLSWIFLAKIVLVVTYYQKIISSYRYKRVQRLWTASPFFKNLFYVPNIKRKYYIYQLASNTVFTFFLYIFQRNF